MWTKEKILTEVTAAYQMARTEVDLIEARAYFNGVLRALNEYQLMSDNDYYEIRTQVRKLFQQGVRDGIQSGR